MIKIIQDNEKAWLRCETHDEALAVRRAFVNYGKCQEIEIIIFEENHEK